jgi:hypothetical protein
MEIGYYKGSESLKTMANSILIAHRGNINGPDSSRENQSDYVEAALQSGFDVEVDIWSERNELFLGHDGPLYPVNLDWLTEREEKLWVHCKNLAALETLLGTSLNYFYHQSDPYTLTSHGYVWAYPGQTLPKLRAVSLWFKPEDPRTVETTNHVHAICGDYVANWAGNSKFS